MIPPAYRQGLRVLTILFAVFALTIMANTTGPMVFPDTAPLTPHCLYMPGAHQAYAVEWYRGKIKANPGDWWAHNYECPVR